MLTGWTGPWEPKKGLLFDKKKILLDPYARTVAGQRVWGDEEERQLPCPRGEGYLDWGDMPQSSRELCDLIIYELHVRGFTRHSSSGVVHKGTFAGLKEKIPYLKDLGVNAVELMPIFEFDETMNARMVDGNRLLDYWGYNTVCFFRSQYQLHRRQRIQSGRHRAEGFDQNPSRQ